MSAANLVLGLGLFFLGMQLVGEYLRRLSGSGLRKVIAGTAHNPFLASIAGLLFGALMQSATAVTFVVAGMSRSGLVQPRRALPVILWCNTGLTVLAFLLSFSIHPLMAWAVGLAGVAFGMLRGSGPRAVAGIFLGVGLILFGLEAMSEAAAPMKDTAWFHEAIHFAGRAPAFAFLAGIAAAAALQSNTGATMLAITLAGSGAFGAGIAAPFIYGTNLGAIFLRLFLAWNADAGTKRLVRFEDGFVIFSGVVMMGLLILENAGVPMVLALAKLMGDSLSAQLAWVFLLSNAIPALLFLPLSAGFFSLLCKILPESARDLAAKPKFLADAALDNPSTALDLLEKETARLLSHIVLEPLPVPPEGIENALPPADFTALGQSIEKYSEALSTGPALSIPQARRLHVLRSELALVRHIEVAVREAGYGLSQIPPGARPADALRLVGESLAAGAKCAANPSPDAVDAYLSLTSVAKATLKKRPPLPPASPLPLEPVLDDLDLVEWLLHRHAKLLARLSGKE